MSKSCILILVLIFVIIARAQTSDEKVCSTLKFNERPLLGAIAEVDASITHHFMRWLDIIYSGKWICNPDAKWTSGTEHGYNKRMPGYCDLLNGNR